MTETNTDFKNSDRFEQLETLLTCKSCQQIYMDPITLFCQHTFCRQCLIDNNDETFKCPECQVDIVLPPSNNFQLKHIIEKIYPESHFTERQKQFNKKLANDLKLKRKYEIYKERFSAIMNKVQKVYNNKFIINNNSIFEH